MTPKTYSGVSCVWCGEPIPVSKRVVEIQDEIERGKTIVPYTFVARCKVCECESTYEVSSVQSFDGEPPRRRRWVPRAA